MDRTAAVIIILGIFLGSIHSFAIQTREIRTYSQPGAENDLLSSRDPQKAILVSESSETVWISPPPPSAPTIDDAQEACYEIENAYGGGRNKLDFDNQTSYPAGEVSRIQVSLDGATATIPEIEKRIFYENFVAATVVLSRGGVPDDIADRLGGIVVEEYSNSLLLLVPEGTESGLDSLIKEGVISSYEVGGWGTGLGKA